MRTFIAFKIDSDYNKQEINAGIERVRKHYYESITENLSVTEEVVIHKNLGAIIFDLKSSPLLWEDVWENDDVSLVTYSPPSNWKKFCKSEDIKRGPEELLSYVIENKNKNHGFSSPTCFATIDKKNDEMNIYTDSIGFSRLYEYRGNKGWFWSNRAGALPLFAGEKAEMSDDGWASLSAAGWFVNNTSPIDKVIRVSQGITINTTTSLNQPRKLIDNGAFSNIVSPRPSAELDLNIVAKDMKFNLDSYRDLWDLPLIVDLTGGKDSRVCAAVVISSGATDVEFRTVANYDDEVEVARELLEKVGLNNNHLIVDPATKDETAKIKKTSIKERMKLYFHSTDGDCTPALVQNDISEKSIYKYSSKLRIAGALGEAAKPVYYNSEARVKKLNLLKNDAGFTRIQQAYFKYPAVLPEIQNKSAEILFSALQNAKSLGLKNLQLLDYFYIAERGRRWPPQSNQIDHYSVFFSNDFLTEAMHLSIDERLNHEFFNGINQHLVPEWKGHRYFIKTNEIDERSDKKMRLWQTSDKEGIEEILNNKDIWNDYFDEEQLLQLWEDAKKGELGAYTDATEKLFYRVMMVAYYQEHLDRLNLFINN